MKIGEIKKINGTLYQIGQFTYECCDIIIGVSEFCGNRKTSFRFSNLNSIETPTEEEINNLIASKLKKETFVDCEMNWRGECAIPKTKHSVVTITSFPVGSIHEGWALSGYVHNKLIASERILEYPIKFNHDCTKVIEKATHARFVKVN